MKIRQELVGIIKEGLKKRIEQSDPAFNIGANRVDIRHIEHLKMEAKVGKYTLVIDEPLDRGGTDEGLHPLGYFLAGAASCLMMQYLRLAIDQGIALDDLQMTCRGHFERRVGGAFKRVIIDVSMKSGEREERIRDLAKRAEEMCYAHNTLRAAGLELSTNVVLNGRQIIAA